MTRLSAEGEPKINFTSLKAEGITSADKVISRDIKFTFGNDPFSPLAKGNQTE